MKAIINGRVYNTENATLIGATEQGPAGCFEWWEAGLYRTPRSGNYFLAGEGGAMTRFARPTDQAGWQKRGEKIIPIDKDEALEWAEQYLDADVTEKEFADMIKEA